MTEKEKAVLGARMFVSIQDGIENEGFDYYFRHYTSPEIEGFDDPKLIKPWKNYVEAATALEEYVGTK